LPFGRFFEQLKASLFAPLEKMRREGSKFAEGNLMVQRETYYLSVGQVISQVKKLKRQDKFKKFVQI